MYNSVGEKLFEQFNRIQILKILQLIYLAHSNALQCHESHVLQCHLRDNSNLVSH